MLSFGVVLPLVVVPSITITVVVAVMVVIAVVVVVSSGRCGGGFWGFGLWFCRGIKKSSVRAVLADGPLRQAEHRNDLFSALSAIYHILVSFEQNDIP